MPCEPIKTPGGFGIICSRGAPRKRCQDCGRLGAGYQCDAPDPARKSKTCDRYVCGQCSTPGGPNTDYCRAHASLAASVGSS